MPTVITYFQHHFPVLSETFVRAEIGELIRRGYDVRVICTDRNEELAAQCGFGDRIIAIPRPPTYEAEVRAVAEAVAALKTDYLHTPWATEIGACVFHVAEALGLRFGFSCHAADIWRRGVRLEPELLGAVGSHRLCETVAVEGTRHAEYVRWCGVPVEKIVITPNSVDVRSLPEPRHEPPAALRRIVMVGRPVEKKGFHFGIDAVRLLRMSGLEIDLEIIGGADASTPVGRNLAEYAARFPFVRTLPLLPNTETRERIRTADALLMPSIVVAHDGDSDGIPTVLAEAMLMNVPVVATDVGSVTDLVVPDETGFIARAGDPASVAGALKRLADVLADRGRALELLQSAARHARRQETQASVNALVSHWERRLGRFG